MYRRFTNFNWMKMVEEVFSWCLELQQLVIDICTRNANGSLSMDELHGLIP